MKSSVQLHLSPLRKSITEQMGLHFPGKQLDDLERGIRSAAREFDFKDIDSFIQWLTSSKLTKKTIELLASHLTIGETYFFREDKTFNALEKYVLPELIRTRRKGGKFLRIWSAGCSSGEEPYSIAILLNRMIPDFKDWNITILATDINPRFLDKAAEGHYREWSFRNTPSWVKENYFDRKPDGSYQIHMNIKRMVTFSYLNLVEDTYPSIINNTNAMDIILCRNVLIYFVAARMKEVIQKICHSLIEGGWLIVSQVEAFHVSMSNLSAIRYPNAVLYMKECSKSKLNAPVAVNKVPPAEIASSQKPKKAETAEPEETPLEETGDMILMARSLANRGKLDEALEWCQKAILTEKLNPSYHYLLAMIKLEEGHENDTIMSLKRVLYLDPNFVLAHFTLGNLMKSRGRLKESGKYFENALLLLRNYEQEDILPESEGITAGRLVEIIRMTGNEEAEG